MPPNVIHYLCYTTFLWREYGISMLNGRIEVAFIVQIHILVAQTTVADSKLITH